MSKSAIIRSNPIQRSIVRLRSYVELEVPQRTPAWEAAEPVSVLVVNSSRSMAKEITHQLSLAIPGASLVYAPSIEIARWVLGKRKFDLVVSDSVLADGGVSKLSEVLHELTPRPDLVVVGASSASIAKAFEEIEYRCSKTKSISSDVFAPVIIRPPVSAVSRGTSSARAPGGTSKISSLGAEIRNDLNNPLQEIVAMVFIAQNGAAGASGEISPATAQALEAIERAAKSMSGVVNQLEDRIRGAVVNGAR